MNIKRNILFTLEKRKKDNKIISDNVPILIRISYLGIRVDLSTGYRIDFSKWDFNKERVINGCFNRQKQNSSEINKDLSKYYTHCEDIFKEFEVQGLVPTKEQLRIEFTKRKLPTIISSEENSDKPNFFRSFDNFINESKLLNSWTSLTENKFVGYKKHLTEYDPNLSFENLNELKLTNYVNYLKDKLKYKNTTIEKRLSYLKRFIFWSIEKELIKDNPFNKYKPKLKKTQKKVIFLNWEELNKLRTYKIPENKQYLERVKDVFLFCCFTGLRHSDVYNLKKNDIKKNHLEITSIKTTDSLIIELNDHSKAIIEKYKDIGFKNNKALPVISNQKMNDYIKELAQLAEINEEVRETFYTGNNRIDHIFPKYALLGTHAGRRTFICNALSLGIPPQVVMKWTGHSDYKAMKPYIDIADDVKANAMTKFNQL